MGFEWLALVMFVVFFVLIIFGYPVAYSFAGTAFLFLVIGLLVGVFDMRWLRLLPNRWFGTMSDFTLLAIIFFVFMGAVFEKSGLAELLLETVGQLLGPHSRWTGVGRRGCRYLARGGDGCRSRYRDRNGAVVPTHHVALRLQPPIGHWHYYLLGHHGTVVATKFGVGSTQ